MFLKRIHLQRFGCFDEFTAEFQPGLNIIRGPNESGKSTLHQALLMALMTQPTQTQKAQSFRSWDSHQWYELQLDIADQSGQVYQFQKDFHAGTQALVLPDGKTAKGRDKIDQVLDQTLGTTSMIVVQSTLCVEQDALADIANGRSEISKSLESVLTGSEDHTYTGQALQRLETHIREFYKGFNRVAAQPGPLAKARDEVKRLEERVSHARNQVGTYAEDERTLAEMESRLAQIEQDLRPLLVTGLQVEQLARAQKDLADWRAQEEALETKVEQIQVTQRSVDEATAGLDTFGALARANDQRKRDIDVLAGRVETLRDERDRFQDDIHKHEIEMAAYREREIAFAQARADYDAELAAYTSEQTGYQAQLAAYHAAQAAYDRQLREYQQLTAGRQPGDQGNSTGAGYLWLLLTFGGLMALAAGVLALLMRFDTMLGGVGLGLGLLLIVAGLWLRMRPTGKGQGATASDNALAVSVEVERPTPPTLSLPAQPTRERPEPPPPIAAPPNKPSYDENPLRVAEGELQKALSEWGCRTIDELNERYARVVALRNEQATSQSRLDALLGTNSLAELERQRRDASRKRRDAEEILEDGDLQRVAAMDPVAIYTLRDQIERLEGEQSDLKVKQQRLSIKLEQQVISKEDLLQAEETLESARADYERARERIEVYELAHSVLDVARTHTLRQAQERLGPLTAGYLRVLTNGRYQMALIDQHLNIELQDPMRPDRHIPPDRLSRGARDQLYMAARLALVDMLFPRTRPPILLDDPFVHFDPERLAAAIAMCCDLAKERQILLFTCSNHYNDVGHHIVMPA